MKTKIVIGSLVLAFLAVTAVMYAQLGGSTVPKVELNARFASADLDRNGTLSKEEFEKYLAAQGRQKTIPQTPVRICPNTGQPCTGDGSGMCSSGNGEDCGGGDDGCGSGGGCGGCSKGASTVTGAEGNPKLEAMAKTGGCGGCSKGKGAVKTDAPVVEADQSSAASEE